MKKTLLTTITLLMLATVPIQSEAWWWDEEEVRFENVYDKPFWQNDAVFWTAMAVASAGAAAFTVYTGGTGAPAAGAGVSTLAILHTFTTWTSLIFWKDWNFKVSNESNSSL